jgi:hypothetical protein
MELVTPNGKQLGGCTGSECMKMGGWYIEVGRKVGAKKVGDVLNESQLELIWKGR